jgi:hypothetical protein
MTFVMVCNVSPLSIACLGYVLRRLVASLSGQRKLVVIHQHAQAHYLHTINGVREFLVNMGSNVFLNNASKVPVLKTKLAQIKSQLTKVDVRVCRV